MYSPFLTATATLALASSASAQIAAISQLDYIDPVTSEVIQPDSRVVRIQIDYDAENPQHLQLLEERGGGYLNIFVRLDPEFPISDWVVQNDYEAFPDERTLDGWLSSYVVGLRELWNDPEGLPLDFIYIAAYVGPEPLLDEPDGLVWDWIGVDDETWRNGGGTRATEDEQPADDPEARETATAFAADLKGVQVECGRTWISPANFPIVEEGTDECLPASHARSIAYLSEVHSGLELGEGGVDQLKDDLAEKCDTNDSRNDVQPNGTDHTGGTYLGGPAQDGRDEVNDDRGWRMESTEEPAGTDTEAELDDVIEKLNEGVDVEFDWRWNTGGGHTVTILQVCKYVLTSDDGGETVTYRVDYLEDNQDEAGSQRVVKRIWINADRTFRFNGAAADRSEGTLRTISTDRYIIDEDINGDGNVDAADLGQLLASWASPNPGDADVNGDGTVNGADMGQLLGRWGPVRPDTAD
jgi:hypothetical protein